MKLINEIQSHLMERKGGRVRESYGEGGREGKREQDRGEGQERQTEEGGGQARNRVSEGWVVGGGS
jgi:hypothetical protein